MRQDRQTRGLLLQAAKEEFLDKGYTKASLRSICHKAGVTTGALYFFFQDKEDLFGSLVETPLREIFHIMKEHFDEEEKVCASFNNSEAENILEIISMMHSSDENETVFRALDYMYRFRDEFLLLITKAQGSKYENCIDLFVELSEQHYRYMAKVMELISGKNELDEHTLHCIIHLQMESFIYPLTHNLTLEQAKVQMMSMMRFLIGGWYNL